MNLFVQILHAFRNKVFIKLSLFFLPELCYVIKEYIRNKRRTKEKEIAGFEKIFAKTTVEIIE